MEKQAPGRAQLERDVANVVGSDYAHQAIVWVAIGMLQATHGLDERAALAYLVRRSTQRELPLLDIATLLMLGQERP